MKSKHLHKYNLMIISLILASVITIMVVCIWYNHKSEQIEKKIYLLR